MKDVNASRARTLYTEWTGVEERTLWCIFGVGEGEEGATEGVGWGSGRCRPEGTIITCIMVYICKYVFMHVHEKKMRVSITSIMIIAGNFSECICWCIWCYISVNCSLTNTLTYTLSV